MAAIEVANLMRQLRGAGASRCPPAARPEADRGSAAAHGAAPLFTCYSRNEDLVSKEDIKCARSFQYYSR